MNRNKGSGLLRGCAVALSFCVATSLFCSTTFAAPESETIEVEPAYSTILDIQENANVAYTTEDNSVCQTWDEPVATPVPNPNHELGTPSDLPDVLIPDNGQYTTTTTTDGTQTSVSSEEIAPWPGEPVSDFEGSHDSGDQTTTTGTNDSTTTTVQETVDKESAGDRIDHDPSEEICKVPEAVVTSSPDIEHGDWTTKDPETDLAIPSQMDPDESNMLVTEPKDPSASVGMWDTSTSTSDTGTSSDSSWKEPIESSTHVLRPFLNADEIETLVLQIFKDYQTTDPDKQNSGLSEDEINGQWVTAWSGDSTDGTHTTITDVMAALRPEQQAILLKELEAGLSEEDVSLLQTYIDKQTLNTAESVQAVQMIAEKIERIVVSFTATMDMPVSIETEKDFVTAGTEEPPATAGASEGAATVAPQESGEIAPSGTEGQTHPVNSSMTSGSDDPTRPTIPPTFIQETTAAKNESVTEPEKAPVVEPPKDTQTADTTQTAETGVPTRPSKPSGRPLPANNNASVANVQTASLRTDTPAAIAASIENLGASGAPTRTGGSASLQTLKKIPTRNSNRALSSARLARNLQATQTENLLSSVQEDVPAEEILMGTRDGFWLLNASSGSRNASMENWVEIEDSESALSEGWSAESIGWTILESLGAGGITLMIYKICRIIPDPKLIWFLLFGRKKKKKNAA